MTIVIPAYNAADVVYATVDSVVQYCEERGIDAEIIVVDDGSRDKTSEVASAIGNVRVLRNEPNRGKGYSVRRGMLEATKAWAMFMDVDNSTTIDHLDRFAQYAADHDVLIASRRLPDSRIVHPQPKLRQALGRTFPYVVRALALPGILDTQCGFKVFRRSLVNVVFQRQQIERFCFDVEVLYIARRLNLRIAEVPVDWDNPAESTVRVSWDPLQMFVDVLRTIWRHRKSRYRDAIAQHTMLIAGAARSPTRPDAIDRGRGTTDFSCNTTIDRQQ